MTVKDIMDRVPASRAGFVYAHELRSVELLRAKDTPGTLAREVKTISWAVDEAGQNIELWLTMQPKSAESAEAPAEPGTCAGTYMACGACVLAVLLTLALVGAAYRVGRHVGYWSRVEYEKRARGIP